MAEIVREVVYQRAVDIWDNALPVAQVAALTYNVYRGKNQAAKSVEDFIGKRPERERK